MKNSKFLSRLKTKKLTATAFMMMWLLAILSIFAFAIQPIFDSRRTTDQVQAGGRDTDYFYINAPMHIAGGSGATNYSTGIIDFSKVNPLFKSDGTVDKDVLLELLDMVNNENVMSTVSSTDNANGITYYSAKSFGQYGDQSSWTDAQKGNAQIVVKLFDKVSDTTNDANLATQQLWQAVYRTMQDKNGQQQDILTLYMARPYIENKTTDKFNPNSADGIYKPEGNYLQSYLRDKTILPLYETLLGDSGGYSALDDYIVAPKDLPGEWQSGQYQTSANSVGAFFTYTSSANSTSTSLTETSYGSSSYAGPSGVSDKVYTLTNGMYGNIAKYYSWTSDPTVDAGSDKLWVPSAFETLYTGYSTTELTTINNVSGGRSFDGDKKVYKLEGNANPLVDAGINGASGGDSSDYRTGLWEMSPYDRCTGCDTWLRSGMKGGMFTTSAVTLLSRLGTGATNGNAKTSTGTGCDTRAAIHIDLKALYNDWAVSRLPAIPSVEWYDAGYGSYDAKVSDSTLFGEYSDVTYTFRIYKDGSLIHTIEESMSTSMSVHDYVKNQGQTGSYTFTVEATAPGYESSGESPRSSPLNMITVYVQNVDPMISVSTSGGFGWYSGSFDYSQYCCAGLLTGSDSGYFSLNNSSSSMEFDHWEVVSGSSCITLSNPTSESCNFSIKSGATSVEDVIVKPVMKLKASSSLSWTVEDYSIYANGDSSLTSGVTQEFKFYKQGNSTPITTCTSCSTGQCMHFYDMISQGSLDSGIYYFTITLSDTNGNFVSSDESSPSPSLKIVKISVDTSNSMAFPMWMSGGLSTGGGMAYYLVEGQSISFSAYISDPSYGTFRDFVLTPSGVLSGSTTTQNPTFTIASGATPQDVTISVRVKQTMMAPVTSGFSYDYSSGKYITMVSFYEADDYIANGASLSYQFRLFKNGVQVGSAHTCTSLECTHLYDQITSYGVYSYDVKAIDANGVYNDSPYSYRDGDSYNYYVWKLNVQPGTGLNYISVSIDSMTKDIYSSETILFGMAHYYSSYCYLSANYDYSFPFNGWEISGGYSLNDPSSSDTYFQVDYTDTPCEITVSASVSMIMETPSAYGFGMLEELSSAYRTDVSFDMACEDYVAHGANLNWVYQLYKDGTQVGEDHTCDTNFCTHLHSMMTSEGVYNYKVKLIDTNGIYDDSEFSEINSSYDFRAWKFDVEIETGINYIEFYADGYLYKKFESNGYVIAGLRYYGGSGFSLKFQADYDTSYPFKGWEILGEAPFNTSTENPLFIDFYDDDTPCLITVSASVDMSLPAVTSVEWYESSDIVYARVGNYDDYGSYAGVNYTFRVYKNNTLWHTHSDCSMYECGDVWEHIKQQAETGIYTFTAEANASGFTSSGESSKSDEMKVVKILVKEQSFGTMSFTEGLMIDNPGSGYCAGMLVCDKISTAPIGGLENPNGYLEYSLDISPSNILNFTGSTNDNIVSISFTNTISSNNLQDVILEIKAKIGINLIGIGITYDWQAMPSGYVPSRIYLSSESGNLPGSSLIAEFLLYKNGNTSTPVTTCSQCTGEDCTHLDEYIRNANQNAYYTYAVRIKDSNEIYGDSDVSSQSSILYSVKMTINVPNNTSVECFNHSYSTTTQTLFVGRQTYDMDNRVSFVASYDSIHFDRWDYNSSIIEMRQASGYANAYEIKFVSNPTLQDVTLTPIIWMDQAPMPTLDLGSYHDLVITEGPYSGSSTRSYMYNVKFYLGSTMLTEDDSAANGSWTNYQSYLTQSGKYRFEVYEKGNECFENSSVVTLNIDVVKIVPDMTYPITFGDAGFDEDGFINADGGSGVIYMITGGGYTSRSTNLSAWVPNGYIFSGWTKSSNLVSIANENNNVTILEFNGYETGETPATVTIGFALKNQTPTGLSWEYDMPESKIYVRWDELNGEAYEKLVFSLYCTAVGANSPTKLNTVELDYYTYQPSDISIYLYDTSNYNAGTYYFTLQQGNSDVATSDTLEISKVELQAASGYEEFVDVSASINGYGYSEFLLPSGQLSGQTIEVSMSATILAEYESLYRFEDWTVSNNDLTTTSLTDWVLTVSLSAGSPSTITITANIALSNYTITLNLYSNSINNFASYTFTSGGTLALDEGEFATSVTLESSMSVTSHIVKVKVNDGYRLTGLYGDGSMTSVIKGASDFTLSNGVYSVTLSDLSSDANYYVKVDFNYIVVSYTNSADTGTLLVAMNAEANYYQGYVISKASGTIYLCGVPYGKNYTIALTSNNVTKINGSNASSASVAFNAPINPTVTIEVGSTLKSLNVQAMNAPKIEVSETIEEVVEEVKEAETQAVAMQVSDKGVSEESEAPAKKKEAPKGKLKVTDKVFSKLDKAKFEVMRKEVELKKEYVKKEFANILVKLMKTPMQGGRV